VKKGKRHKGEKSMGFDGTSEKRSNPEKNWMKKERWELEIGHVAPRESSPRLRKPECNGEGQARKKKTGGRRKS